MAVPDFKRHFFAKNGILGNKTLKMDSDIWDSDTFGNSYKMHTSYRI